MAPAAPSISCALVTGGGGGIGKAFSAYLISKGIKVIIAGRTRSKLESTTREIGAAAFYTLDTGDIDSIPKFVSKVTREHPDLDCLVNNAGVQRPLQVSEMPAPEFLEKADQEIDINIRGPIHLTLGLFEHFRSKQAATVINLSSALGFMPYSVINPVYNATKAWVHFWTMNLRTQIEYSGLGKTIKVIEIAPPAVESDLHRERDDPDDNKKTNNGSVLSVYEFMAAVSKQMENGEEMITTGAGKQLVDLWYQAYGDRYKQATN
ncbi:uncharacterized protein ASPGLDRAFT_30271 [Aspergillus glaucus CBS 516.65]|uniref:Uncharacterized protein n=1 Tax=Aspergillus glaucus CBS 516.65 TaxID=1160497 RepID=A0A1L9V4Y6_ASPGL|nr:hypothetical protein ASPGLDRAFT_30271 [Aspergillus glaucus CBS 516.65]OJJ78988.1 hypothetical protein ASPGLDRAFT_30271 [Aspergillus glaucus CBS 516.65]